MSKWILVRTRKPKRGQHVLVWCGWAITATYKHPAPRKAWKIDWCTEDGVNPIFMVTHWMELPEPPTDSPQ